MSYLGICQNRNRFIFPSGMIFWNSSFSGSTSTTKKINRTNGLRATAQAHSIG